MTYYFMNWLRMNFKDQPEIIEEYINCFLSAGNNEINIEAYEPEEFVNYSFSWNTSKFSTDLWNEVNDSWYAYCRTLFIYGNFENIQIEIKFGDLIKKSKKINNLNINFDMNEK